MMTLETFHNTSLIGRRVMMKNGTTGKVWKIQRSTRGYFVVLVEGDDKRVWRANIGAVELEYSE